MNTLAGGHGGGNRRALSRGLIGAALAVGMSLGGTAGTAFAAPDSEASPTTSVPTSTSGSGQQPGTVYAGRELPRHRLLGGSTEGNQFTYWSTGADDKPHLSTAILMVPKGTAPRGGWPIVAWAHGSRGIADGCAPSVRPVKADTEELQRWLERGFAVVSSDYAGLGTPGTPQYYDLGATARNIVDAVRAAKDVSDRLARSWAVVGQAQGASAAIELARLAPELDGPKLEFRGAAASSIPADFGTVLTSLGPNSAKMPAGMTADALYTLSAIRNAHRDIGLDAHLTETGKRWMSRAATLCAGDLVRETAGLSLGSLFSKPLNANAALTGMLTKATTLPTGGFSRPVLMTQGLTDESVVVPLSLQYLGKAKLADRRVDARTYLTLSASEAERLSDNDVRGFIDRVLR